MESYEGIQDQQARFERLNSVFKGLRIRRQIQSQRRGGDDLHVQISQPAARGGADSLESPAHDVQSAFGPI